MRGRRESAKICGVRSDAIDPGLLDVPYGVATRGEWLAAGASERMFRDGRLLPLGRPHYALAGVVTTPAALVRLVGALAPAGTVVSGWAAGLLHGVRDAGPTMLRTNGAPIQLSLARGDHRCPPAFTTLRVALAETDVQQIDGLAITTPARTAYDMARFSGYLPTAVAVLDAFRYALNPTPIQNADLLPFFDRSPRGRGHPLLRRAILLSSSRSRSMPESRLRVRVRTTLGLPDDAVAINAMLQHEGRCWELDLLDWTSGLVIEYDSLHHASTEQRERDAMKDLDVREAGLRVIRVNSLTLNKPDGAFAEYLRRGQLDARSADAHLRAAVLRDHGLLAELPLTPRGSAVVSRTLSGDQRA